jgi:hypothetical protein
MQLRQFLRHICSTGALHPPELSSGRVNSTAASDRLAADRRLEIGRDLVSLVSFGFPQQEKQDIPNNQEPA